MIATLLQWSVLSKQLEQMKGGSTQTDRLITEANRIATSMEQTSTQSKAALDASIAASRLDQRAWVGARMATGPSPFKTDAPSLRVGEKIIMGVVVINSGKTPALHLTGSTDVRILPKGAPFFPRYRPIKESYLRGDTALTPGGTLALMARPSEEVVTQKIVDDLRAVSSILYLFGSYTYDDAFGVAHFTKFCMFASSDLASMISCNTYNEAN